MSDWIGVGRVALFDCLGALSLLLAILKLCEKLDRLLSPCAVQNALCIVN